MENIILMMTIHFSNTYIIYFDSKLKFILLLHTKFKFRFKILSYVKS